MKCLTVAQPWAWAIIHGPKRIENRTWRCSHIGPLLIHAGKSREWIGSHDPEALPNCPEEDDFVYGAIIGMVTMVGCEPITRQLGRAFAEGPWCWMLCDPVAFHPVPYRGAQGLFDVPQSVIGNEWVRKLPHPAGVK